MEIGKVDDSLKLGFSGSVKYDGSIILIIAHCSLFVGMLVGCCLQACAGRG